VALSNRLTGLLDSRKYLEDNEITLIISLLVIDSSAIVRVHWQNGCASFAWQAKTN
jgi:hypothetical protein